MGEFFEFLTRFFLSPGLPNKDGDVKPFRIFWVLFLILIFISLIGNLIGLDSKNSF
jgi:hypothetical protein